MVQLYIQKTCPFCLKVMAAVEQMGLAEGTDFEVIDGSPGTAGRKKVVEIGGKSMVPFLVDGDTVMYESDDIIDYMKEKP